MRFLLPKFCFPLTHFLSLTSSHFLSLSLLLTFSLSLSLLLTFSPPQLSMIKFTLIKHDSNQSEYFREWLLTKIINGERASYSAPKFARMQVSTCSASCLSLLSFERKMFASGSNTKPNARGHRHQSGKSSCHGSNTQALQTGILETNRSHETLLSSSRLRS